MSLWVDRYRPNRLSKLDYHKKQAEQLSNLVAGGDFPHLLVYGPSGAGKKTRVMCILRELYGRGVEKQHIEQKTFEAPSGKRLEVSILSSNYHIQLNPSEVGYYDWVVIQEIIKGMAQTQQLDAATQRNFKGMFNTDAPAIFVVLNEVDRLSRNAQHALRRTMEKYSGNCRLILCCPTTSKVIAPLRSRCLAIRIAAPSNEEVVKILQDVCRKEGVALPDTLAERIAEKADGNLRKALLMCETCRVQQLPMTDDQNIPDPDWQVYLRETARLIIEEQSPDRLAIIRERLYELLTHCIPPEVIFQELLMELLRSCDAMLKAEVTNCAAEFQYRLQLGSKAIYHLEAFIAKFMSVYKKFLEATLSSLD